MTRLRRVATAQRWPHSTPPIPSSLLQQVIRSGYSVMCARSPSSLMCCRVAPRSLWLTGCAQRSSAAAIPRSRSRRHCRVTPVSPTCGSCRWTSTPTTPRSPAGGRWPKWRRRRLPGRPCKRLPPGSAARPWHAVAAGSRSRASDNSRSRRQAAASAVGVLPELHPRDGAKVHVVRPVRDPQRACVCPHAGEREVVGNTATAVHLDGAVDDVEADARCDHLDGGDLGARALRADAVDEPRGLQRQQPGLLDLHARLGDRCAHGALLRECLAERNARGCPLAHQLESALGYADGAHAVVDAARTE